MEKNELPNSSTQESNTRWWESYLVRYFLGFAVGSMCVFLIGLNYGNKLDEIFGLGGGDYKVVDAIKKLKIESSVLLISISILGVCYCYVAREGVQNSSPSLNRWGAWAETIPP